MRTLPITSLLLGLLVPGCSGSDGGSGNRNPKVLWLATDVTETRVKLIDTEPGPF